MTNYAFGPKARLLALEPDQRATRTQPEQPFDGLQDNNLGNGLRVNKGETRLVLRAHGRDNMPTTIGISAGYRLFTPEGVAPVDVAPVGILKYGTGGANVEIEMDLLSAMIFNVPATSFDFEVSNPFPLEPEAGLDGADIFAQASFGVGAIARAGSNPCRRTIRIGQILAGASSLIEIPTGAVAYNVFTTTVGILAALKTTQSLSPRNTVALSVTSSPVLDTGYGSVPLVSGTRGLEITNTAGANADGVRVVFTLAF